MDNYTGMKNEYYDNGKLKFEVFMNNGKMEGVYKKYYSDGKIKEICCYIDGKLNGEYIQYHNDGSLFIQCNYVDNKKHGKHIFSNYDDDEHPYIISNYKNDKLHGKYEELTIIDYMQQQLFIVYYTYDDGIKHGECKFIGKDSYSIFNYVNGKKQGNFKVYYNNNIKATCNYVDDKFEGDYIEYYIDG